MVVMLHVHTKILELFDEKLDLVFLGIAAHVAELFVFVSGNDFVDYPSYPICNGDLCLIGGA